MPTSHHDAVVFPRQKRIPAQTRHATPKDKPKVRSSLAVAGRCGFGFIYTSIHFEVAGGPDPLDDCGILVLLMKEKRSHGEHIHLRPQKAVPRI
jgi:hypothetical protein